MPPRSSSTSRTRPVLAFTAVLVVMAALGALAVVLMGAQQTRSDELAEVTLPEIVAIGELRTLVADYRLLQLRTADGGQEADTLVALEGGLAVTAGDIDRHLGDYEDLASQEEDEPVSALVSQWARYRSLTDPALGLAHTGRLGRADAVLVAPVADRAFATVQASLAELADLERAEALETSAESRSAYGRARGGFLGVVVAAILLSGGLGLWFLLIRPNRRAAAVERFRHQFGRAVDMADSEEGTLSIVAKALSADADEHPAELLLADSSQSHLLRVLGVGAGGTGPGCTVDSPGDCVAVRRGQAVSFASSETLDACPKLAGRASGPCSAVCVPVTVLGLAIGVLHSTGAAGRAPSDAMAARLEAAADLAGSRLGVIRAMTQSQLQASTDPLTGLLNRRSFEDRVQDLRRQRVPYVAAMGDLDHFKQLNDTYGHETGDRALRVFSRALLEGVRTQDVVARYGGEEFAVVFPRCSATEAAEVIERVRVHLAEALESAHVPPFTFSFGIAEAAPHETLNTSLQAADEALMRAKRAGRARTLVASGLGRVAAPADAAEPHTQ